MDADDPASLIEGFVEVYGIIRQIQSRPTELDDPTVFDDEPSSLLELSAPVPSPTTLIIIESSDNSSNASFSAHASAPESPVQYIDCLASPHPEEEVQYESECEIIYSDISD